ncbi:MAG: transcription antitermination factor NusB [Pseudomonadales bacterium]|nr:transcription antitermination factor NusB [Pseudomonadales bacterium]NIX08925.1 transcription antitermination factor NusB [Pseudomonadales bacterium]
MNPKPNPWARRRARRALVQAVYQWQMTGVDAAAVTAEFGDALTRADRDFFQELLRGVLTSTAELDALFAPLLDRDVDDLDHVERAILRLGAYELAHRIDVPYRVVIDEYVELAKLFGAEDGYKYVNGVLDRLSNQLRVPERSGG